MSRIIVIGSCQAKAIATNLAVASLDNEFHYIELQTTELSMEEIYNYTNDFDFIICFALDDANFGPLRWESLRATRRCLIIPRIYFSGFHSDFMYAEGDNCRFHLPNMEYHLRLALSGALHGINEEHINSLYGSQFYVNAMASGIFEKSLEILREKESVCDVTVSDLILRNSASVQPLFTFNHPSPELLYEWVIRIGSALIDNFGLEFNFECLRLYFAGFFDEDIILPVLPGTETNKFPMFGRGTSVRLASDSGYRMVTLRSLIKAEYDFVGSLSFNQREELHRCNTIYKKDILF